MKKLYSLTGKRGLLLAGALTLAVAPAFAQNKAVDYKDGMPFSQGVIAGNTLYVAGQEGPDANGKLDGDIAAQTHSAIANIQRVVEKAGFKMSDIVNVTVFVSSLADVPAMNKVYIAEMPNPKPARATVQVAGLIGGAKIEIACIAVKH